MIDVQNVRKEFDGFAALGGATLTVPNGAVYGLVGPNGAGKSTLIRHITGIYRQDVGEITVDGEAVFENPSAKARIASIPDDWYYFLQSDVRDMMRFYRGFYPKFNMERYEKFKEVFSIDEKRTIRRLSKGMQKQVAFWLAMCTMPDYLRELEDVCDHVGIMDHGKVLLQRSLEELQGGTVKVQMVPSGEDVALPEELEILHRSATGRVQTLIVRGSAEEVTARLSVLQPLLLEALPLSLEEIFIYELGGVDYAVKDIVL